MTVLELINELVKMPWHIDVAVLLKDGYVRPVEPVGFKQVAKGEIIPDDELQGHEYSTVIL